MSNVHSMIDNQAVLEFYKDHYYQELTRYELLESQELNTAHPLEALKACEQDSDRHPVVILYGGQVVGFFVLHGWEGVKAYYNDPNAILLRAYSIEAHHQGKGLAQQSLRQLEPFVKKHFPDKKEIILAVNHKNFAAQYIYEKDGFNDKGLRVNGKRGEQFVYHKTLI